MKKSDTNISSTMDKTKLPLKYIMKIKRGVAWSVRRIEITKERIKYFKLDDNELRFNEAIEDCMIIENRKKNSNFSLLLVSRSNKFKDVKMFHEDPNTLKKFKHDFDYIYNYKTTLKDLENKTFVIEAETKPAEGDINSTLKESKIYEPSQVIEESVMESNIGMSYMDGQSTIKVQDKAPQMEDKEVEELNEDEELTNNEWNVVKFTKNSVIEYNGDKKEILPYLYSISEKKKFRERMIQSSVSELKDAIGRFKDKHNSLMILVILSFIFSLSMLFVHSSTLFFSILIIAMSAVGYYNKLNQDTIKETNEHRHNSTTTNEVLPRINANTCEDERYLRITSIFNVNSKEIFNNYIANLKSYKEWNFNLISINEIKREDNTCKLTYSDENETIELSIKRSLMITDSLELLEAVEVSDSNGQKEKFKVKVFSVDQSPSYSNKSRVTITIPVRHIIARKISASYVNSTLKSLDLLHVLISQANFTKDSNEDLEVSLYNDNNTTRRNFMKMSTSDIKFDARQSIRTLDSTFKRKMNTATDLTSFYEMGNRFSEAKQAEGSMMTETKPEEPNERETPQVEIKKEPEKPVTQIDPLIQKENEEVQSLLQVKLMELDQFLDKPWNIMEEKPDYKLYYFDEKSGLRSVKSECVVDKNIKTVWEYINDINNKSKFDKNFDCGHTIRDIDDKTAIQYMKYKGKLFISSRDFTIISHKQIQENSCMLFATTYTSEKYPRVKGVERADLKVRVSLISISLVDIYSKG